MILFVILYRCSREQNTILFFGGYIMKEIRETKMVEQTTIKFVANDGKEFVGDNAENECKHYEAICNENECKRLFGLLDYKKICIPFANWFADYDAYLVNITSERDYNIVRNFFEVRIGRCAEIYLEEPKSYPYKTMVIETDCYADEYHNIANEMEKVKTFMVDLEAFFN